jgi:glycosidase
MQWEPGVHAGFSDGDPWLDPVDPFDRNVSDSLRDGESLMWLYRSLIELRGSLGDGARLLDAADGVVAYERGDGHVVALNFTAEERPAPEHGEVRLATGGAGGDVLAGHSGFVARRA